MCSTALSNISAPCVPPAQLFEAYNVRYGLQGPAKYTGDFSTGFLNTPSYFSVDLPGIHLVVLNDYLGPGANAETSYYLGSGAPLAGDAQVGEELQTGRRDSP